VVIVDLLLSLLYPPRCPSCDRDLASRGAPRLCRACRRELAPIGIACPRCGEPGSARTCTRCLVSPPPFARAHACFVYRDDGLSSRLVLRWKYDGDHVVGASLAELLVVHRTAHAKCYDVIVPVPLHAARLASRGFNQAAVLARAVRRPGERLAVDALQRDGRRVTQATLNRAAREENVRDAFRVRPRSGLSGRSVLLIDDVVTTGATVRACSAALRDAGAASVDVWSLARTASHRTYDDASRDAVRTQR
jgi:ComF family protein